MGKTKKKNAAPRPFAERPYRQGVGIMLVNGQGHVFAGLRIDTTTEAWQMPQGGIDEGEDPRTAAHRELWEETGTRAAEIVAESAQWLAYDLPPDLADKVWKGYYRGQTQKWFVMRFTGTDGDIRIDGVDGHKPEFREWRWVPPLELPSLIVGFKRDLYARLVAEFTPVLQEIGAR